MSDKNKEIRQAPPIKKTKAQPKHYEITLAGAGEIAEAVNALVQNKYARQGIFAALNEHLTPIM